MAGNKLFTGRSRLAFWVCLLAAGNSFGAGRPYTPADVERVKTLSDPALSPDGRRVAYVVSRSEYEENRSQSDIFTVAADGSAPPTQITHSGKHNGSPAWSPDGKVLGFISERDDKNESQVYLLPMDSPGEARRVTDFPGGVNEFIFTPDGRSLILAARVYPDAPSLDTVAVRDSLKKVTKMKVRVHDRLLYRHWDTYWDGKATHLFGQPLEGGNPVDLTPSLQYDALNYWLASAGREFSMSPDGRWLYFAGNQDPDQAVSYNTEVYRVPAEGGAIEKLSVNPAADNFPRPSPDGRWLAWRATRRPYYESDEYDLVVMELASGKITSLTDDFNRSVADLFWSASSDSLFFSGEDEGDIDLFVVSVKGGPVREAVSLITGADHGYHTDCQTPAGEGFCIFLHRPLERHNELARLDRKRNSLKLLTAHNDSLWAEVYVPRGEDVYFEGADGARVHGMVFLPVNFDPSRKYPLLVRIHGGPQQMFGRAFRHEYALFAGRGYVVFACNPRGSTGYGQRFTDQIRGDWDGRVIRDLKLGVRHVLKNYDFINPKAVLGWGDSFGGFVCNWLEGHNDDGLFTALITHAGDADQWSAYGSTEELWFPEWESYGPPWDNPALYDNLSPVRYAKNFRTPLLITHGDLDWRVPVTGAEQMFTALQRLGVPSKFIRFPDEGHWILKPQNRRFWYESILDWADKWCK